MIEKIEHSKELIRKALEKYPITKVFTSWGKDSIVALHLALSIKSDFPCVFIDTGRKPEETYRYMEMLKKKWNLNLEIVKSKEQVPDNLHKTNPDECCRILKVEPTKQATKDLDCWVTGLRKDEGRTRADFEEEEKCEDGSVKLNPILNWTEADVWRYLSINNLPANPLYAKGFRSLGCACCTSISDNGERDGRWKGTCKEGGECGIHTKLKVKRC